jgi:Tfp pilus assembly protein PilO
MDKIKQWALLTVVAVVAIAAGGWFLLISPQRSHASDLRTQTQTQQTQNESIQNELASLQSQHKGLPQVQADLAKLGVQLPNNPGLPALIRSLSSAADAAGVDLISLTPTAPQAVASAAPAAAASPAPAAAGSTTTGGTSTAGSSTPATANVGALASLNIQIVVNGGYFHVEQFVSNLEALARPFLTTNVALCPQAPMTPSSSGSSCIDTSSATGAQEYDGHMQATINGQVFMVSGPAAAPSTATK